MGDNSWESQGEKDQERASHHGIDGNLKRVVAHVNSYVLMQIQTGCDLVNGPGLRRWAR